MKRLLLATALVTAATFGAHAADLIVQDAAPAAAPASSGLSGYVQVMGGMSLASSFDFPDWECTDDPVCEVNASGMFGATIGFELPMSGLSVEVDALTGTAEYSDDADRFVKATTVMGNLVFTAPLNDSMSLYAGAGAGLVMLDADYGYTGSGAGYQVFGGAQMAVTENISLTLEARHQGSFSPITVENGDDYDLSFNRTAILGGVLFSF